MDADPVRFVLDRVAMEHPSPAHYFGFELEEWNVGAEAELTARGLLQETTRTTSARCAGCERGCHKPVIVRTKHDETTPTAHIECDEEPKHGRIPVRLDRLRRWRASLQTAAYFSATCLRLPAPDRRGPLDRIPLGSMRGRKGMREVAIILRDQRILLSVGQQEHVLHELVWWRETGLHVDHDQIKRLANRKRGPASASTSEETKAVSAKQEYARLRADRDREIVAQGKRLRKEGKSWTTIADEIAGMPFIARAAPQIRLITVETIRRILSRPLRD